MRITIAHLYKDLLNLYGDKGNIVSLIHRLKWRGIDFDLKEYSLDDRIDFSELDIIFLGGGSDKEQAIVCKKLLDIKDEFKEYVENDGVVLAVCGGYQLLGNYYKVGNEVIKGLGVLNITTESKPKRIVGDIIIKNPEIECKIVGFENHSGRTDIGEYTPFGKVLYGKGNNDTSGYEGVEYKNLIGTYIHGPILPKNPQLCDYILKKAIRRKNPSYTLSSLYDFHEFQANEYIVKRFLGEEGNSEESKSVSDSFCKKSGTIKVPSFGDRRLNDIIKAYKEKSLEKDDVQADTKNNGSEAVVEGIKESDDIISVHHIGVIELASRNSQQMEDSIQKGEIQSGEHSNYGSRSIIHNTDEMIFHDDKNTAFVSGNLSVYGKKRTNTMDDQ